MNNNNFKILLLNYEFPPLGGGASPISASMAQEYARQGCEVDIVTMGFKGLPSFESRQGVNIYRLKCWRSKKELCHPYEQLTFILSAWRFFKHHLKNNKYDFCHTHFIIPTGIIAYQLNKKYKIPYIITSHGSDIPGYNPDRFKFLHLFTKPPIRRIANCSKGNFAGSQYLVNLANKQKLKNKYCLVPDGFDNQNFFPRQKKNIILYTGRLLPRKGAQHLITAVSGENLPYEVHIAGDGPLLSELQALAKKSKTKIVFHGWLDNQSEKYQQLLGESKIYVLPSEKENSSVSLLEAMSSACAVISSNVSGCPEIVGDSGILVPPRNPAEIKKAILKVMGNEEHYGQLARRRVVQNHSWEKIIQTYLNLSF